MDQYRELFSVAVQHDYFVDGGWRGLDFQPNAATRRVLGSLGAGLRLDGNRLVVFYQVGRREALTLLAQETGGLLTLVLRATSRDRSFRNFTQLDRAAPDSLLCFTNGVRGGEAARLSLAEAASAADLRSLADVVAEGVLSADEAAVPPDFLLDIRLDPALLSAGDGPCFNLRFATRTLLWNYLLLGGMNRENLFIVDLDERVEFEPQEDRKVAGQRPAKVFRSKIPLPMQERSPLRFQLRERGMGSGKVVVKRLPVASSSLALQWVDGQERLVSNMYVNF